MPFLPLYALRQAKGLEPRNNARLLTYVPPYQALQKRVFQGDYDQIIYHKMGGNYRQFQIGDKSH